MPRKFAHLLVVVIDLRTVKNRNLIGPDWHIVHTTVNEISSNISKVHWVDGR